MKSRTTRGRRSSQRGYVLLTLLLFVTLMVISAAVIATDISMQIRRDREEELIHRGTEYRRAVRRFAKSTGRFPMSLSDLENTNGTRYLRKHYRDPMTGKDFRVLHMTEIPAAMGTSANTWSLNPAASENSSDPGQQSSAGSTADPPQNSGIALTAQSNNGFSSASNATGQSGSSSFSSTGNNNTSFGGGMIIGVVSTSSKKTIREFNRKNRYNQWFFFYDPTFDRGFDMPGPTPLVRPPANLQQPANSANQPTQFTGGSQQSSPQSPPAQPSQQ